jgi:translation initiation factor 3 subunit H
LDVGSTLEVTHCFPFPNRADDEADDADGANYQLEMMRRLREVGIDNNTMGWYQSTYMGSYHTTELIETFLNYQDNINRCVCIIYDPARSLQEGTLALKAIKLSDKFMQIYRKGDFSVEKLREGGVKWDGIFVEMPVSVHNPAMATALMTEMESDAPALQDDLDRLDLSAAPFLEKNLEFLAECLDDLYMEQQKWNMYERNMHRQKQQQLMWLDKRRQENASRRANGEEPLPEEDPTNPIFRPVAEPGRLDTLLISNSIGNYCDQTNSFAAQVFSKLELMKAVGNQ